MAGGPTPDRGKAEACRCGQMDQNMKATGELTRPMERAGLSCRTETYSRGYGSTANSTVWVSASSTKGKSIKGSGSTTRSMDKAKCHGLTEMSSKATSSTTTSPGMALSLGRMGAFTKANLRTTLVLVKEF